MNINEFQDYLRNEVIKNVKGKRNESTSLIHWVLVNVFDLDTDFAKSIICDGNKDKGVDAIFVDDLEEIIYVFQGKYKTNNDHHIGDKVLRDFSGVKNWFKDQESVNSLESSTINPELKNLIQLQKLEEIINDYSVEYHFISNAFINDDTEEFLEVEKDIKVWDIETLLRHYHLIEDDPLVIDKHIFEGINADDVIELEVGSGMKSIMVPIEAQKILELKGIEDLTLFNKNVRYGLGNTRVNKAIKSTINDIDESKNFLLFHNGISMVCEAAYYIPDKGELHTENYSVVNGAQSILTFYKEAKKLNGDIRVLLRVTQVGDDKDLISLISKYNNNQNSISMKDLRSKDKIQNRLTKQFEELDSKYGLNIRYSSIRGQQIPKGKQVIYSDYAGQLMESCYLQRSYNIHLKASMFDSRYSEIFSKNTSALRLIMYYRAHNTLNGILDKIDDKGIADYGLAQHFLIMVLFDILNSDPVIKNHLRDENKMLTQLEEWDAAYKNILSTLIKGLNKGVRGYKQDEENEFIYKNFFKSKDSVTKLHNSVRGDFEGLLELNDSPLVDVVSQHGVNL